MREVSEEVDRHCARCTTHRNERVSLVDVTTTRWILSRERMKINKIRESVKREREIRPLFHFLTHSQCAVKLSSIIKDTMKKKDRREMSFWSRSMNKILHRNKIVIYFCDASAAFASANLCSMSCCVLARDSLMD